MTVEELAEAGDLAPEELELLRELLAGAAGDAGAGQALTPRARPERIPLAFAQQRLWLLDQLNAGNAYNLGSAFRLRGPLNHTALAQSLTALVRRHEALRT